MLRAFLKCVLAVAIISSATMTAFAEDAPVFDVDSYPPQFDEQPDAAANTQTNAQTMPSLTAEQRLSRVEQQMINLQRSDSSSKMEALQNEVQTLRGQVEQLTHQLQQARNQQRVMYSDLDKRIGNQYATTAIQSSPKEVKKTAPVKKIISIDQEEDNDRPVTDAPKPLATSSHAANGASATNTKTTVNQPDVAEEQKIYQTAYDLIKVKKYNEAIMTLKKMLQKYPSGQFAANAHYWLGELYGLQGKNDQSATEFAIVVKDYPDSPKVSDAQLKLGLIYAAQFKWPDAKTAFKKVIAHYPGTASARLATEQLKQIKQAGH